MKGTLVGGVLEKQMDLDKYQYGDSLGKERRQEIVENRFLKELRFD